MVQIERLETRRLKELAGAGEPELWLQADFANGRHHARKIEKPWGREEVSEALHLLAEQIAHDSLLG
jgi:hypothetical protein